MKFILAALLSTATLMGSAADWEYTYQSTPLEELGWFYTDLDPDLRSRLELMQEAGPRLLDIGSGHGTQSMALAREGFVVTATDISATAMRKAQERADALDIPVTFMAGDVTRDPLGGPYDVVLDRACLHCLSPREWLAYVEQVAEAVRPSGLFILKCYSIELQLDSEPPHRFTKRELHQLFDSQFDILQIESTVYQYSYQPNPPTYLVVMRKR